jgi:predicted site-specific integrase-resolvase
MKNPSNPLRPAKWVELKYSVSRITVWRWERDGLLPPATIIGGKKYWKDSDINALENGDGTTRRTVG